MEVAKLVGRGMMRVIMAIATVLFLGPVALAKARKNREENDLKSFAANFGMAFVTLFFWKVSVVLIVAKFALGMNFIHDVLYWTSLVVAFTLTLVSAMVVYSVRIEYEMADKCFHTG